MCGGAFNEDDANRNKENCVIVFRSFEKKNSATIEENGLSSITKLSQSLGDHELHSYLSEITRTLPVGEVRMHAPCRNEYADARKIKSTMGQHYKVELCQIRFRSCTAEGFSWREHCLICGSGAILDSIHTEMLL